MTSTRKGSEEAVHSTRKGSKSTRKGSEEAVKAHGKAVVVRQVGDKCWLLTFTAISPSAFFASSSPPLIKAVACGSDVRPRQNLAGARFERWRHAKRRALLMTEAEGGGGGAGRAAGAAAAAGDAKAPA